MVNTALKLKEIELPENASSEKLTVVEGNRQPPACFLAAKAKLKNRTTPQSIFNNLTQTQRNIIIYAAGGFKAKDCNKSFEEFSSDQCIKIQKAIVELGAIKTQFSDANILQMARFTAGKPTDIHDDTFQTSTDYLLTDLKPEPY